MIKVGKLNKFGMVRMPDTLMIECGITPVDIHFGNVHDIAIVCAKNKVLSADHKERIFKLINNDK